MYLYGEGAKGLGGGIAYINGILISLSPTVSAALTYRDFDKDYHSFFNQAVSESSEAVNEKGLYAGLNINPNKHEGTEKVTSFSGLTLKIDQVKHVFT
ncbi:hypothetical protein [Pedobacter kyonggii]|uniref:Uncharacterized protein n=1 Tax=Pedobacter kyonggii TaxID=1926871 RepID=A0A4Q9H6J6_9SPHI|nr:hypothetical protein [Pedobacter kyonggii]TBO37003.1 hypothetical protein EYS08_23945 [Pedobacter kyonggii]